MATRGKTTFQKRQKELARKEKQQRKAARREQRKLDNADSHRMVYQDAEPLVDLEPGSEPREL